ncbi:uncharacterized protein LOC134696004 [Mytilus trossulus]|uniref:uncharacterized protein LOC134696004 n=1 Tax=Mytilus trossulus TaxID=6551 RepID=UPI003004A33E
MPVCMIDCFNEIIQDIAWYKISLQNDKMYYFIQISLSMMYLSNILLTGLCAMLFTSSYAASLSYNYFDEMAQTYCTSQGKGNWVFAIRRDCNGIAPTCNSICSGAKHDMLKSIKDQRNSVACFDAYQVRKQHAHLRHDSTNTQPDAGKVNMVTYGYGSKGCSWRPNHCGPNYCCCKAF